MNKREIRCITKEQSKLRLNNGPSGNTVYGYAIVFNQLSLDLGGWKERIKPESVVKTIQNDDQWSFFNHNQDLVLGRKSAGTLKVGTDSYGVYYEVLLGEESYAKDLRISLQRNSLAGSSFGFNVIDHEVTEENGEIIDTIKELYLWDVSPVVFPAYPQTTTDIRQLRSILDNNKIKPINNNLTAEAILKMNLYL